MIRRAHEIQSELSPLKPQVDAKKKLLQFEHCACCGSRIIYFHRLEQAAIAGPISLVEGGSCSGCLKRVPERRFAIH